jgi:hypothetical protein
MSKGPSVLRGADVKQTTSETPPLTRAGRKIADAVMAAAKFRRTMDGTRMVRQYEVYGMVVTECVNVTEGKK